MIPVSGLYESHLTVSDLDRSVAFYRDVVGLEFAHAVPQRGAAFFWVGGRERSMLGLWSIGSSPLRFRLHIAFATTREHVVQSVATLRSRGILPRAGGGGPEIAEPMVFPWMPAASVYFDDPDGHSLEYVAVLDDTPRPSMAGTVPLSEWDVMHGRHSATASPRTSADVRGSHIAPGQSPVRGRILTAGMLPCAPPPSFCFAPRCWPPAPRGRRTPMPWPTTTRPTTGSSR